MAIGRIREITFDDGAVVSGDIVESADKSYVDAKFDPHITAYSEGIWLDNTSGLPTLSPWRAGVIVWDDQNKCMAVSTAYEGSWLQIGEETQDDGYNDTGATLTNGTVVYIDGAQGNRPKLWKATASDLDAAQKTIGLVTASSGISDNAMGPYTTSGVVRDLNTNAYAEGTILWLSTTSGEYTSTIPTNQYRHIMIGIVIKQHNTQGEIYVNIRDLTDEFALAGYYITDPHGWTENDNTYMTRSWDETNRIFTLTQVGASTPYYAKGKLKFLTGNKTITLNSNVGMHHICLNVSTEQLEDLGSSFPVLQVVTTHIFTEYAYVDASGKVILYGNERHTTKFLKQDWLYKHRFFSTQYVSGLQPAATSIDGNGSSITHAQFSITSGVIQDEDIPTTIAQKLAADNVDVFYYNVTSWEKTVNTLGAGAIMNFPATRLQYNNPATGLVECTNNYHVLSHVFAANNGKIMVIVGQAQYQTLVDARLAAKSEINTLITSGLPILEYRAVATFIYKTSNSYSNALKAIIVSVDTGIPFYDWRTSSLNPVAGNAVTNHNNLTGLQGGQAGEYYHLNSSDYNNIVNKIYTGGAASDTGAKFVFPTKSDISGLTAAAGNSVYDTTAKKLYVADGSTFKVVGGGLIVTNVTVSGTTPSIVNLEAGKHYVVDMSTATGDVTLNAPATAVEATFKVSGIRNFTNSYRIIVNGSGSDKFYYAGDSTNYNQVRLYNPDMWIEFSYNSTNLWVMNTDESGSAGGSGTGTGKANYIKNPSAFSSATDYWTATGFTVSRDISTSIPRETTTGTGFKLISSGSGDNTFLSSAMLLDDADLNRKLGIEIAINVPTASKWQIEVLNSATENGTYTRMVLPTDVSSKTYLPNTVGTFKSSVDMDGSKPYIKFQVKIASADNSSAGTAYFSNIILTPDSNTVVGPVVGNWIERTPSISDFNNATSLVLDSNSSYFKVRRIGESIELNINYYLTTGDGTSASALSLNTSVITNLINAVIDTSKINTVSALSYIPATGGKSLLGVLPASGTAISFYPDNLSGSAIQGNNAGTSNGRYDRFLLRGTLPISSWYNSGTVTVAQNDVEFASNSAGDSDADNTTSFAYGPAGSYVPRGALTGNRKRRIRFQSPIQSGDKLDFEIFDETGWKPLTADGFTTSSVAIQPFIIHYNFAYGAGRLAIINSTDVDVYFGTYRHTGSAYDSVTSAGSWVDFAGKEVKWRVRKTSAGAAVGFGIVQPGVSAGLVSANGLPGRTDGQAVPSGYVGQELSTFTTSGIGTSISTLATLPLTKGTWLLFSQVFIGGDTTARVIFSCIETNSSGSGSMDDGSSNYGHYYATNGNGCGRVSGIVFKSNVDFNAYLRGYVTSTSGISGQRHWIKAIRIA